MNFLSGQHRKISPTVDDFSFERIIKPSNTTISWESIVQSPINQPVKPVSLSGMEAKIRQQVLQTQEIINQLANSIPSEGSFNV